jgi:hypothetical protein
MPGVGVEQTKVVDPHVERHDDRLERHHEDADDGEKEDVPAGELVLGESKSRERGNHHAAHGGDRRDDRAVQQIAPERLAPEDFDVVAEVEPVVGGDLKRHALDLGGGLQRCDRHPEKREEDEERAARDRQRKRPAKAHAPQYWIGLRKIRHCSNVTAISVTKTKTAITDASPKRKNLNAVS